MRVAGVTVTDLRPVGGGDICLAFEGRLRDDRPVFVKTLADAPERFFAAEADGLQFLKVAGAPPVPDVVAVDERALALSWVEPAEPSRVAAERFGRALATLHRAGPESFGAAAAGFIGSLSLDNERCDDWPEFYATRRVAPYLAALDPDQRAAVEQVCERIDELAGPAEPPARIHGDLWSGNLLWSAAAQVWLVDAAAAHGGHRETDIAMLALFGAPFLDVIIGAYDEVAPLSDGWRARLPPAPPCPPADLRARYHPYGVSRREVVATAKISAGGGGVHSWRGGRSTHS